MRTRRGLRLHVQSVQMIDGTHFEHNDGLSAMSVPFAAKSVHIAPHRRLCRLVV